MHNAAYSANPQENTSPSVTADEVNKALGQCGYQPLSVAQFVALSEASQVHLKLALQQCRSNPQALNWILTNAGVRDSNRPVAVAQKPMDASRGQPLAPPARPAQAATATREAPVNRPHQSERKYGRQFHVYMGSALCFECTRTKDTKADGSRRDSFDTITIDFAKGTGPKQYDWGNKMRFQLTEKELPAFTAVLMGWAPEVEFKGHGREKNKSIKVAHQGNKIFITGITKGFSCGVPVCVDTVVMVTSMCWEQLAKTHPALAQAGLLDKVVASTAARMLCNAQQGAA